MLKGASCGSGALAGRASFFVSRPKGRFFPPPHARGRATIGRLGAWAQRRRRARSARSAPTPCLARTRRRARPARLPPARARLVGRICWDPGELHLERQPAPAAPRGAHEAGGRPPTWAGRRAHPHGHSARSAPSARSAAASCTTHCMPRDLQHTAHLASFSGSWACRELGYEGINDVA